MNSHQLAAFFILTFFVTWGLGYSWILVVNKGIFFLAPLTVIATVGPALAGIIISAISNTQPKQGTKRSHWIAFLIAWVVSALVFLANNTFINHAPFSPVTLIFTLISVVPVAFVISMVRSRLPEVRSNLASLVRFSGVWGWSLLAIVFFPALVLLSILISSLLDRQPIEIQELIRTIQGPQVLRSLDMEAQKNSIFGFLGHNGAGKTSLFKPLLACSLLLAGCNRQPITPNPPPTTTPTAIQAATPTRNAQSDEYLRIFETVWQTVNDTYFDPEFGGLDWRAEYDHYQPLIAEAENDQAFYQLLNQMLWKLKVSHMGVGPADMWSSIEPTVSAEGTTGLDLRLLDGALVITRVEQGSSGAKAGLQPGFVLESIDGIAVEQIIAEAEPQLGPPYNDRGRIEGLTRTILSRVYGTPDTCVTLVYLDEHNQQHETCVARVRRERFAVLPGTPLPPFFLEFEAKRLEQDIGYLRFNTFHLDLVPEMQNAIQSMRDAPGIIVDLRGNPGADIKVLPNGALLIHPVLTSVTPDGTLLERRGVIPDIKVELDRELLLKGIDSQLEAAVDYIEVQAP